MTVQKFDAGAFASIESNERARLRDTVQRNCHIADARHARDLPLCVYLMRMREYYRWESGSPLTGELAPSELGEWLHEREQFWDSVQSEQFACLPLPTRLHDAFDEECVNRALVADELLYSAGIGRLGHPQFFLARLLRSEHRGDIIVRLTGEELARNCTATPAMSRGRTIYVRRDALRRHLWEVVQEWQWGRTGTAARRVLEQFDFHGDQDTALENLTDAEVETAVLHELGELAAGALLGPRWERMLNALLASPAEPICRAVRDNLADCSITLPVLLDDPGVASLDRYFASFGGMRRELFPAAVNAYHDWVRGGSLDSFADLIDRARRHWCAVAREMLDRFEDGSHGSVSTMLALAEGDGRL